jgi:hypothetical protein
LPDKINASPLPGQSKPAVAGYDMTERESGRTEPEKNNPGPEDAGEAARKAKNRSDHSGEQSLLIIVETRQEVCV